MTALALAAALLAAAPAPAAEAPETAPTIAEIAAREGVSTELSPSVADYAHDMVGRLARWFVSTLAKVGLVEPAARALLWALVVGVPLALAWWVVTWWRRLEATRRRSAPARLESGPLEPPAEEALDLRQRLEALLAAGRRAEALAALWAFVAGRLSGKGLAAYAPQLTNREFVAAVAASHPGWEKMPRLAAFTARVDRLLYAGAPIGGEELDRLVADADEIVA